MKYSNIRAFEKHVEEASPRHFSSLYMLIGKDSFARKSAADKLIASIATDQKNPELCLKTFNADEHTVDQILQELNTLGFFTEKKIILIHNAEKFIKSVDKLEPYFNRPLPSTYLILSASSLAANTNLYKKGEKAGVVLELPDEKPWEKEKSMQAWLVAHAASNGKKLDMQAALFLLKQAGTDQASLYQEMEKLFCYVGDSKEITMKDIASICARVNLDTIWQLGEAIFKCDVSSTLRTSKGMLEDGTAFLAMLKQIRSQFETELQICCILANGGSPGDVAAQFPYMKGSILERHIQAAQNYGMQKLKAGLLHIDAAELKVKNSSADAEVLNEWLMIKLAT